MRGSRIISRLHRPISRASGCGRCGRAKSCLRPAASRDRKSTRLNSSHTVIYTLSLHDALPIYERLTDHLAAPPADQPRERLWQVRAREVVLATGSLERSEERRVGKECRSLCDWSSDVCSSDL